MRTHTPETGWRSVPVHGVELAYFEHGPPEAPLVLLQHGYPDTPHTWSHLVPSLVAAGYRVVCPWGRGITPSTPSPDGRYGYRVLGEDLAALIPALGAERAHVVGHDWGAAAAWAAAHLHPERIDRLVAVAIPHPASLKPSLRGLWQARHFVANKMPWAAWRVRRHDFAELRVLYERWSPGFDWPDRELEAVRNAYAHPPSLDAALGYYRDLWLWPFRGRVEGPDVLVIGGLTDGALGPDAFEASRRRVTGSCTVTMLPGGHFLHREHPEPFEAAVLDFLGPASAHA